VKLILKKGIYALIQACFIELVLDIILHQPWVLVSKYSLKTVIALGKATIFP